MIRRRPVELWWISAFCLFKAAAVLEVCRASSGYDRNILAGFCAAGLTSAIALPFLFKAGRWLALAVLGVAVCDQCLGAWTGPLRWHSAVVHAAIVLFCAWMIVYLLSTSTRRLFGGSPQAAPTRAILGNAVLDLLETSVAIGAFVAARSFGLDELPAGAIGVCSFLLYRVLLDGPARRIAMRLFAPRPEIPESDLPDWRGACRELSAGNLLRSRQHVGSLSQGTLRQPEAVFLRQVLAWHELLQQPLERGRHCLRRAAFDHDWKPDEDERQQMEDFIEGADCDVFRALADERAALIEGLVAAGQDPGSFYFTSANRALSRITGEDFTFNTPEDWAAWWNAARADWSGDAGLVALAARLLRLDPACADALARRVAGRAEEPLLRELTAQALFLNGMQKAIKDQERTENFVRQPQRMLLVPELCDAVGLLHVDSPLLDGLGMTLPLVARRMQARAQLIDYAGTLWRRYPVELYADMPWLLKTLTGRSFGRFWARRRFERWWPAARESLIRHDRAVVSGLAAHALGDEEGEERAWRNALKEHPSELAARYNLAHCMMKRKKHAEAARLLKELTRLEPKEHYWWIVLGDIHRSVNRSADAQEAFRRALQLGAPAPKVALHIGLTLAQERRDAEAIKHLDRALGSNPTTSKIEALVSHLENEGLWKLAGHYREEAFRRGLSLHSEDGAPGDDALA